MRAAFFLLLLFGAVPAAAQKPSDDLCRAATGSGGCLDFGRRDGYRREPSRPTVDREETAEQRAQRWRELQESLANMEHPKPERPLSRDTASIVREDVETENKVLHADSRAMVLVLSAGSLAETLEVAVLVEAFIAYAPYFIVTAVVVEAARSYGWIFAKSRKPPHDAWDPNGAKAPGKPGTKDGFKDPKGGEQWGQAPNGKWGWVSDKGNVWVPTGQGGTAHRGPHWDEQLPGGGHTNRLPGGGPG